jgi:hypothetical protein
VEPVEPVSRQIDDEAGLGQPLAQVVAGLDLVFDDQDFHACTPSHRVSRAANFAAWAGLEPRITEM